MTPPWFRSRPSRSAPPSTSRCLGCALRMRRLNDDPTVKSTLSALAKRYDVTELEDEARTVRVVVDDAYDRDEAVAQLALALDELDNAWESGLSWPRAEGLVEPDSSS